MKKVFLAIALVSVAVFANAQAKFGAKAGANFYQFGGKDGSDLEAQKMKAGFYAGGLANFALTDAISIQPELLFSNQGTMQKEGSVKINWHLNYINVPVMAQYNNSGFYAETGPEFGFLLSAKAKSDGESADIKDSFKSFNFSWGLGAGYKLSSGLGIGARYNLGLTSIIDESSVKATNNGFQVGLFYMFGGK